MEGIPMRFLCLALLAFPTAAFAQSNAIVENTLQVTGVGKVNTPPDVAEILYWVRGEGKTPDEASNALVATRKAIKAQVASLLSGNANFTDGELIILPVRGSHCDFNAQPRLSEGDCAITGYFARAQSTLRTADVAKAGTAIGLASRLGASDARLQGFQLADVRPAQRAAMSDAVADANRQATAMASAAGRRLGAIVSMRDQNSGYGELVVTGTRIANLPPPPPPPPPVEISLSPRPIETDARVDVTYTLLP
jgi:uncharacterized protein